MFHENKYFYKESYCLFTEIYVLQETTKIWNLTDSKIPKDQREMVSVIVKYVHDIVHLH